MQKTFTHKLIAHLREATKIQRPLRYVISKLARIYWKSLGIIRIQRDGYHIRISPSGIVGGIIHRGRRSYTTDELYISTLVRDGEDFWDIGSNIGHISLSIKSKFASSNVYAVEAHPETYGYLCRNISSNKSSVIAINKAVGEKTLGEVKFSSSCWDDCNYVQEHLVETTDEMFLPKNNQTIHVQVTTLDALVADFSSKDTKISCIKIDTEGYEYFVLKGAKKTLKRTRFVYFEYWHRLAGKYGYSFKAIESLLNSCNLTIYKIPEGSCALNGSEELIKASSEELDSPSCGNQNLLAINNALVDSPIQVCYSLET